MPKTVYGVIFDLGRVLVGVDMNRPRFVQVLDAIGDGGFRRFCTGRMSLSQFHRLASASRTGDDSLDCISSEWCEIFYPMGGMEELFRRVLCSTTVGLLSDTDPVHWRFLVNEYEFLQLIDSPILSFNTGLLKPNPECYMMAARSIGREPHQCIFIDDIDENVAGAVQVGMKGIRFTGAYALGKELAAYGVGH